MNLRQHIDFCVKLGQPRELCVVVNFWMGLETIQKHSLDGDLGEVDLTLLTDEELMMLDKKWTSDDLGRRMIEEEISRRSFARAPTSNRLKKQ